MVVEESLVDYKRNNCSKDEDSEDSHAIGGGNELSPSTAKQENGKMTYTPEDKAKRSKGSFFPRLKCLYAMVRIFQGNALRGMH